MADSLEKLLGKDKVFRDEEDIKPGEDFVKAIEQNLQYAKVFCMEFDLEPIYTQQFRYRGNFWNCH